MEIFLNRDGKIDIDINRENGKQAENRNRKIDRYPIISIDFFIPIPKV